MSKTPNSAEPETNHRLLEVNNLKTYFYIEEGVVRAVNDVSFSMKKGETLGLVGESGCGKSVTSLSIMRLVPIPPGRILSGSVKLSGEEILQKREDEMRKIRGSRIAMIFQEPMTALNPVFTVRFQIGEMLKIHTRLSRKEIAEKVLDMLEIVGIPEAGKRVNAYPHELSGGMRQRVMIAMALSCDPELLIADEPTTALDVTIQAQILELIKAMQVQFDSSVILITHDLAVIAETADTVAVMYAGVIVETTSVEELFGNPKHPYTIGLLNSIPILGESGRKLKAIPGRVPNLIDLPEGCYFQNRCPHAMPICSKELPLLKEESPGHMVRCFLYE